MPRFRGRVELGERVILANINGNYFAFPGRRHGRGTWSGDFATAEGNEIKAGVGYRLTLDDGRSGDIIVDLLILSSHDVTRFHFRGVSPLQASNRADGTAE